MPWIDQVAAVLEARYPGQKGGEAIADILSGAVNPSGRLPVTFPRSETQLPHPKIEGDPNGAPIGPVARGGHYGKTFVANYSEGAAVGYKWFFARGERPLFPFGYGLSYSTFGLESLKTSVEGTKVTINATIHNSGARAGVATAQFYVSGPSGANIPLRLAGWSRITLEPGERRDVGAPVDPRLLATFDEGARRWRIRAGDYQITAGFDVEGRNQKATFHLEAAELPGGEVSRSQALGDTFPLCDRMFGRP
jgi:beta-glucosidase